MKLLFDQFLHHQYFFGFHCFPFHYELFFGFSLLNLMACVLFVSVYLSK